MRGTPPALPLTVNSQIRNLVQGESRKVSLKESYKQRLIIILRGIEGKSKYSTAKELGIGWEKVHIWRNRWESEIEQLIAYSIMCESGRPAKKHEILARIKEILARIKEILADKPRSGTPKRITLSEEQQIVAIACDKPEDHNIPMTNWTHQMLAHVAKTKGIVDQISPRHVGNILKKRIKTSQVKILVISKNKRLECF